MIVHHLHDLSLIIHQAPSNNSIEDVAGFTKIYQEDRIYQEQLKFVSKNPRVLFFAS